MLHTKNGNNWHCSFQEEKCKNITGRCMMNNERWTKHDAVRRHAIATGHLGDPGVLKNQPPGHISKKYRVKFLLIENPYLIS